MYGMDTRHGQNQEVEEEQFKKEFFKTVNLPVQE